LTSTVRGALVQVFKLIPTTHEKRKDALGGAIKIKGGVQKVAAATLGACFRWIPTVLENNRMFEDVLFL
jgi:hypothetical protein